jgi:hypothetical protein
MKGMDDMNRVAAFFGLLCWALSGLAAPAVELLPASEPAGYIARLLINEALFPGERGYVSEEDTKAAMRALLLVLDARSQRIPPGYTRKEIADTPSSDVIDIITAGGYHGQVEGFYRDTSSQPCMASRVTARLDNLLKIAAKGSPGRFARLLNYAQTLASDYLQGSPPSPDFFEAIRFIPPTPVVGRAYSWMTDQDCYHPGGSFVRIPNNLRGRLSGNRFFTLQRRIAEPARPAAASPSVTVPK